MDYSKFSLDNLDNWSYLKTFFPNNWATKMKELKLLKFGRKFCPDSLCRIILMHLIGNISLRTSATISKSTKIANVSDVGILKRLKKSSEWFNWMTNSLLQKLALPGFDTNLLPSDFNFRLIDGSIVKEPGLTGSQWWLHYSVNLSNLKPDEIKITSKKVGETLKHFLVNEGDVFIADRGYSSRKNIFYVHSQKGYSLIRLVPHNLPMNDQNGNPFQLLRHLRKLSIGEVGNFSVQLQENGKIINGRMCAIKRSKEAAAEARKKLIRKAQKNGTKNIKDATLEQANYVLVFTTLPQRIKAEKILEIYRLRWQIELVFKRLKSILKVAPLYKKSPEGMSGWLSGKIFVSVLIEYVLACSKTFFPWGYPI